MGTPCVIHQPKYNMFDRWIETEGLVETLAAEKIGAIVFSPLAQGLLTNKYLNGIPQDSRAAKSSGHLQREEVAPALLNQVRQLHEIAQARGQSLAQMALAWALRLPVVASVLVGVSSSQQLEDNLAALENADFSAEELAQIEGILG